MLDSQDPEKGHIPLAQIGSIQHLGVPTEEDKDLEIGEDGDEDSNHPGRASSADTIEPAPIETTQEMYRSKSQSSSQRSRPMSIIPRSKRRGFLGRFTVIPEVGRPHEYANSTKWTITFIIAIAAAAAPMGSAIFYRRSTTFFPMLQIQRSSHIWAIRAGESLAIGVHHSQSRNILLLLVIRSPHWHLS